MPDIASTILLLFCLLQLKHMLADFFMQTPRMLTGRAVYFHMGRAQHAGVHMLMSIPAFLLVGANTGFVVLIVTAEWVVHFNLDWCKARYSEVKGLNPTQARFWQAMGVDQAMHHLTYVVMVWAWLHYGV